MSDCERLKWDNATLFRQRRSGGGEGEAAVPNPPARPCAEEKVSLMAHVIQTTAAFAAPTNTAALPLVEHVTLEGELLVVVLRTQFRGPGIHFFTPDEFSQQLGYMLRPKGYSIPPHTHNPIPRTINWTQEVLFIKSGLVRLDVYGKDYIYYCSVLLRQGDVVLMAAGGHGLVMLEESEIVEVKQGPYVGPADKSHFEQVADEVVVFHDVRAESWSEE